MERSRTEIVLNAYAAHRCPCVTHNTFAPDAPPPAPPSPALERLFEAGNDFEDDVEVAVAEARPDLTSVEAEGWEETVDATMRALRDGAAVVVGGRLPDVDGRAGAPDLLVRVGTGYLPVDVKNHGTLGIQKKEVLLWSSLDAPETIHEHPGRSGRGSHRTKDAMQLAHYTRMLQSLGLHAGGRLLGGIIGTSDLTDVAGDRIAITWHDLESPTETTYSASAPGHRRQRSIMERYDHEHAFRTDVAREAIAGGRLVRPIATDECATCVWFEHCSSVVGEDEVSFRFPIGRLSAREWLFLESKGADTIEGLAALDAGVVAGEFASHAVGKQNPAARLAAAIDRARMIRDDVHVEPVGGWPEVPSADVEVDFDVEWDLDQRIYQWGIRVRERTDETTAQYIPVVSFEPLDEAGEEVLAERCADVLSTIVASVAGGTVAIYHWSNVEVSRTQRFPRLAALLEAHGFDLLPWTRENFRMRAGYSIKDVAPLFDFAWGVDDAGGFSSMAKIEAARAGDAAARTWCLEYNEADVAAQAAIRDGFRRLRDGT